ncbi:hypothetical protein E2562_011102 [Oryza meyeriana var. granulata]|uniref:Uncharacterized protein n=1 Tax=Oryza meyeriana var. granulata TaxID=110450 RepID=A0A6G1EWH7_9ORYZ|nr:hypothetical protein E2562_011102 [Oryza meyeriana var. granulata]
MKKKGKMPAKVKKITFTGSQTEPLIHGSSRRTVSTDPELDAQKPPIMKKTCRKRKVDSDDDDKAYQRLCEELNVDVKSNITYERLVNEIKQRPDDAEAVRFFIMILINKLLIPTTSLHIIGMNAYLASDLSRLSKVDWSRLVLELLRNNIRAWQQSAKSGFPPEEFQIDPLETPRIQFYTKEIVKSILKLDRDPDDATYGCVSLKPIEGTYYYHDNFEVKPCGGNHGNP